MKKNKKKTKKGPNKATKLLYVAIGIIIIGFLVILYLTPSQKLKKSEIELDNRKIALEQEKESAQEIKSKLAYLNTPAGIKHIAKLNGFVEPGEVVIQLTDNPTLIIEKPRRNIFGKESKLACEEHTIKGKPHYNKDCVVCQKINKIYLESKNN